MSCWRPSRFIINVIKIIAWLVICAPHSPILKCSFSRACSAHFMKTLIYFCDKTNKPIQFKFQQIFIHIFFLRWSFKKFIKTLTLSTFAEDGRKFVSNFLFIFCYTVMQAEYRFVILLNFYISSNVTARIIFLITTK